MIHHWEQFHYFLGSKYFPEVGYDGIYVASLAAERELDLGQDPQPYMRDLRTNEVVPVGSLVNHMKEVRERFSDERWEIFREDVRYFLESEPLQLHHQDPPRPRLQPDPDLDLHRPAVLRLAGGVGSHPEGPRLARPDPALRSCS